MTDPQQVWANALSDEELDLTLRRTLEESLAHARRVAIRDGEDAVKDDLECSAPVRDQLQG